MTMHVETVRGARRLQVARSFFVQTPLLNPGFGGTGKWTVVLPHSRKSYQAAQVDRHRNPALFNLLLRVSTGEIRSDGRSTDIDRLIAAGMIVDGADDHRTDAVSYTDLFHEFVTDYPFYDYSEPNWLDEDIQRMRDFKALEPPPPITTPRSGAPVTRPERSGTESPTGADGIADDLFTAIDRTFGPVGSIEGFPVGPWHRKVVPSGGARHPVEAWVEVRRRIGWLPAGLYVYDVAGRCLRETGGLARSDTDGGVTESPEITVYLRARVDRAMWRYRDARSWRAILIDAGHCAQALATNADLWHWTAEVRTPRREVDGNHDWLEEPWLLAVGLRRPGADGIDDNRTVRPAAPPVRPVLSAAADVITQPLIYGTFAVGQMYLHDVASGASNIAVDELDLAVLTHCMYSRRNDRRSDAASIKELFGSEGVERRQALADAGILWPRELGLQIIKSVRAWSDKGWYLTALAHADVRSSGSRPTVLLAGNLGLSRSELDGVAARRRTCRTFDPDYVLPAAEFAALLASLDDLLSATPFRTTVVLATTAVEGFEPGFYRWAGGAFEALPGDVDKEQIRHATIGQSPAGAGGVTLWLAVEVDRSAPGSYELRAASLGMAGQRLCTVATSRGLGVFVTPAVKDSETSALFGIDLRNSLTYTVTIGRDTTAIPDDRSISDGAS